MSQGEFPGWFWILSSWLLTLSYWSLVTNLQMTEIEKICNTNLTRCFQQPAPTSQRLRTGNLTENVYFSSQFKVRVHHYEVPALGAWATSCIACTLKKQRGRMRVCSCSAHPLHLRQFRISLPMEWTHPQSVILSVLIKHKSKYAQKPFYLPKWFYILSSWQ